LKGVFANTIRCLLLKFGHFAFLSGLPDPLPPLLTAMAVSGPVS
jgi:hypothetical protein